MNRPSRRLPATPDHTPDAALVADVARRLGEALGDTLLNLGGDAGADQAALTIPRAAPPVAPARLAAAHPGGAAQRQQARARYERCLVRYRNDVRPQDQALGIDDVGAVVAHFVAVNLEALQGIDVTPAVLLRLERQLIGLVQLSPAWAGAKARERQMYFEQLAILTVYVAELSHQAHAQGPDAVANVRRAARGYLQTLLGLNPDRLSLGSGGLAVSLGAAAAA